MLSARPVLTEVAWRAAAVAVIQLGLSIWFFRSMSGKILRPGILLHGKEPAFKEIWRGAREV